MTEVYPDTNAFSYFMRHGAWPEPILAEACEGLRAAVHSEQIRVVASQYHLEELARITYTDSDFYRRVSAFFWSVVGPFVLLPTDQLIEREAAEKRRLEGNERFSTWSVVHRVRA